MDVRRFPSRQDAESENPLERLSSARLLPRGKGLFFWLLFFGPLQRKVTRPLSGRKPCCASAWVLGDCTSGLFLKFMARCGALQMCRISNRDAARTRFDQAMRESGRRV